MRILSVVSVCDTNRLIAKREDVATSTEARLTLTKSVVALLISLTYCSAGAVGRLDFIFIFTP